MQYNFLFWIFSYHYNALHNQFSKNNIFTFVFIILFKEFKLIATCIYKWWYMIIYYKVKLNYDIHYSICSMSACFCFSSPSVKAAIPETAPKFSIPSPKHSATSSKVLPEVSMKVKHTANSTAKIQTKTK